MPETSLALIPGQLETLAANGILRPRLSLAPGNETVGLVHSVPANGRQMILYLGSMFLPSDSPRFKRSDLSEPDIAYLEHCRQFKHNPVTAVAQYVSELYALKLQDPGGPLDKEYSMWLWLYRKLITPVLEHITLPEGELGRPHLMWSGPLLSTGRPQANLQGLDRVPVYRLLWPFLRPAEPIPDGRPRKLPGRCGEVLSNEPDECTRMCVNPHHFIGTVEMQFVSDVHGERGSQEHMLRSRWMLKDMRADTIRRYEKPDGTMGWEAQCPNEHRLSDSTVEDVVIKGKIIQFTCRACADMVKWSRSYRGRMTARTRARHDPTAAELVGERRAQQTVSPKPTKKRRGLDDDDAANWDGDRINAELARARIQLDMYNQQQNPG